jgi:ABC-type antimicrobial peptide transport system permease subunit
MGLFGLAAFTANQKKKEIGIRRVLGASVTGIISMLSKEFLQPVVLAFIVAAPVAWYGMHKWLEGFAYRVAISPWIFVTAGTAAFGIALLTVGLQTIRTALANPVESLRSE